MSRTLLIIVFQHSRFAHPRPTTPTRPLLVHTPSPKQNSRRSNRKLSTKELVLAGEIKLLPRIVSSVKSTVCYSKGAGGYGGGVEEGFNMHRYFILDSEYFSPPPLLVPPLPVVKFTSSYIINGPVHSLGRNTYTYDLYLLTFYVNSRREVLLG